MLANVNPQVSLTNIYHVVSSYISTLDQTIFYTSKTLSLSHTLFKPHLLFLFLPPKLTLLSLSLSSLSLYFLPSNNILLATISLPIFSPNLPRLIHKNGLINGINKIYFMGYFPLLIKFS